MRLEKERPSVLPWSNWLLIFSGNFFTFVTKRKMLVLQTKQKIEKEFKCLARQFVQIVHRRDEPVRKKRDWNTVLCLTTVTCADLKRFCLVLVSMVIARLRTWRFSRSCFFIYEKRRTPKKCCFSFLFYATVALLSICFSFFFLLRGFLITSRWWWQCSSEAHFCNRRTNMTQTQKESLFLVTILPSTLKSISEILQSPPLFF